MHSVYAVRLGVTRTGTGCVLSEPIHGWTNLFRYAWLVCRRINALEKKDKGGSKSKMKLQDLRDGIHGEVTSGGLLGEGYHDPLSIEDDEVIVAPGSKLPAGQTTRE
jgi:hypothetical protein